VSDVSALLQQMLAAEHAAVYGYGVVGAHLAGAERDTARDALHAHERRVELLETLVRQGGGTPKPAAPAYRLAHPVTGRARALQLAVHLEHGIAAHAYAVAGAPRGKARTLGVDLLADAATRATEWRQALDPHAPPVEAFPGRLKKGRRRSSPPR
jgi:hypothetical protein